MGFPTEIRKLWNKQMWERKPIKPVIVPILQDEEDYLKDDKCPNK